MQLQVAIVANVRVVFIALGSRGDVQPYVALGVELKRAGHTVTVVTTVDHERLVGKYGLAMATVPFDVKKALQEPEAARALERGVLRSFRTLRSLAERGARAAAEVGLEACRAADVIVTGFGGALLAGGIAQLLGKPLVQAYNVPLTPTAAFPGALTPGLDFGPRSRRLGHWLSRLAVWLTARMSGNLAREQVLKVTGAPLLPRGAGLLPGPVLYGFSTAVLPRDEGWPADVEVTGFWFTEDPPLFVPGPELSSFLAAGPAPVCIGFGSMSQTDPQATTRLVLDAVERAGVRAVLLAGWGQLEVSQLPASVLCLESAPHSWLYPRCRAVVHHGGAGTTAAALRAGVPAVVVPFHGDQPFWASRVLASGTGPPPVPKRKLTAERLAAALQVATRDEPMARAARALGERIRAENGAASAARAIERLVAQ